MREITLRQIEVIRAVMLRGTINGAAEHLNVSAPGISRLIKHAEQSLGLRLFERKAGLFVPSVEAKKFFDQIGEIYKGVENLQFTLDSLKRGEGANLAFSSAPSVASFISTAAIRVIRERYPDLYVDLNIVKYEEALEYVLLEQGEFALMTSPVENPGVKMRAVGKVPVCVVLPFGHPLENQKEISVRDLPAESIIGVDPDDPYGAQLYKPFKDAQLDVSYSTRGRFAQTVISLVRENQGVALVDKLSVLNPELCGVVVKPLIEPYFITVYAITKSDRNLSSFAADTINVTEQLITKSI